MNCIITGGTKGIGLACAELFAQNGHQVAICARNPEDLQSVGARLQQLYPDGRHLALGCDMKDPEQIQKFAQTCLDHWQQVDVLINNAGVFLPGNLLDEADGQLAHLVETNLYSAYHMTRAIAPAMIAQQSGHIFNMCSVASINAYDAGGSYAISKFALYGFSQNLRHELKTHGIRVTTVLPGATLTPSWAGTTLPENRFIDVHDVAMMVYQTTLLSPRTVVEEILIRPQLGDL